VRVDVVDVEREDRMDLRSSVSIMHRSCTSRRPAAGARPRSCSGCTRGGCRRTSRRSRGNRPQPRRNWRPWVLLVN